MTKYFYCRDMHPVARTIKVVKIKPSLATTVQDIYNVLIIIAIMATLR
jgi:hypothetical protein